MSDITCDGCGQCCMHMRSPPHIVFWEEGRPVAVTSNGMESDPDDYARLAAAPAEARSVMIEGIDSDRDDESPCSWLDQETKRCRWYEYRPDICHDFELGGEGCLNHRRLLSITD